MRKISSLNVGDEFRPAHPRQKSANNLPMDRAQVYVVSKIFEQSPGFYVCATRPKTKGDYTLPPGTPILYVREPDPTVEQVMEFLGAGRKKRLRVIGYKILWDGKTELKLAPQAKALMQVLLVVGGGEVNAKELHKIFGKHLHRFWDGPLRRSGQYYFQFYRRVLIDQGLIEEVLDKATVPPGVRDANLVEEYRI